MTEFHTYEEAAQILGVTPEAVRCRAKRGHWRRSVGNDGRARIMLPEGSDRARPPGDQPGVTGRDHPDDMRIRLAAAEAELRLLRDQLLDMRDQRDHWRVMAEKLTDQRARPAAAGVQEILSRLRAKAAA